jgi:hypothetical protein
MMMDLHSVLFLIRPPDHRQSRQRQRQLDDLEHVELSHREQVDLDTALNCSQFENKLCTFSVLPGPTLANALCTRPVRPRSLPI